MMVYEFEIRESSRTTVAVKAQNPDDAQKIFSEWYENDEDHEAANLLDNGYEGRSITRKVGVREENYNITGAALFLPKESPEPVEPTYHLHIRFADGSNSVDFYNRSLRQIGQDLAGWGDKYYLFPDAGDGELITSSHDGCRAECPYTMWIYAVLKDREEEWCEIE